jgi:SAM-dependent methyltransferase
VRARLLSRVLRAANEGIFFPRRQEFLANLLAPYVAQGASALDVGSSSGRLARKIQDRTGARFAGVDIHIPGEPSIPVTRYDGKTLPFEDSSFDCVTIVDVLHHTEDPAGLLAEARRVARDRVLIKDHYWETGWDLLMLRLSDYIGNKPYGIVLPYNFLSIESWLTLFRNGKLSVVEERRFRIARLDPCKHVFFHLSKSPVSGR